ncbi:hypothetical protein J6P11_01635 [bacterium]|nr:hypothetical protein [bacterium]
MYNIEKLLINPNNDITKYKYFLYHGKDMNSLSSITNQKFNKAVRAKIPK